MKTASEIRDATKERVGDLADVGKKAAYAVVGAPVVAGKHIADYAGRGWKSLQKEFEAWVTEGERLSGEVREGKVVAELKERVDFDQLQGRVEKLKHQLEDVLTDWRDSFRPGSEEEPEAKPKTTKKAAKPAAKKTTAKKKTAPKQAAKEDAAATDEPEA